jgi:hypothetical protein
MNVTSFLKGMSVLEVIIGASIMLVLTTAIGGAWQSYIVITRISNEKTQAGIIVEETADAIQFIRDMGWATNLSSKVVGTPYYLTWATTTYTLSTIPNVTQNLYVRSVTFSNVARDVNDNIVSSGTNDIKTKKVSISVATNQTTPEVSVQTEMLIHDVYNN